jgi:hypothetical protein
MARLYALQLADQRAMEKQGVRENPIRRGGYSGGAAPTQPVRFELASERAEEIQANRTNPRRSGATPTMGVSQVRGGFKWNRTFGAMGNLADVMMGKGDGGAMRGGRAVPSSGLSQFRGGAGERMVGAGHGSDSDSDEECEGMGKYEGMGKLTIIHGGDRGAEVLSREKASRPAIRSGLSAQHSAEAKQMGQHLGSHLLSVKGGGFFELFTKGIVEAGQKGESVAEQTGMPNANAPPPPTGIMTTTTPPTEEQMGSEPTKGSGQYRGTRNGSGLPSEAFGRTRKGAGDAKPPEQTALDKMLKGTGYLSGQYEGMGEDYSEKRRQGLAKRNAANAAAASRRTSAQNEAIAKQQAELRAVMENQHQLTDAEKRKYSGRRTSGMGGARATRAAIVKKVMAEKGCSMIEASKYVKAHGLYKGGAAMTGGGYEEAMKLPKKRHVNKRYRKPFVQKSEEAEGYDQSTSMSKDAVKRRMAEKRATDSKKLAVGGKKRRAPAGPSDGRRKRAEIVKKVMAEKGCSMIEASKHVKAAGLY